MKENYCSFEQAVKLKDLGFAEKVNHAYLKKISIEPELSVGDLKEVHSKDPKNYNDNRKGAGKGLFFYSAPALHIAQTWLREVKHIYVYPEINCLKKWFAKAVDIERNEDLIWDGTMFDTYELALSAGIDKALELLGKEPLQNNRL